MTALQLKTMLPRLRMPPLTQDASYFIDLFSHNYLGQYLWKHLMSFYVNVHVKYKSTKKFISE